MRILLCVVLVFAGLPALRAQENEGQWYRCIVKAPSHTGYYTFRIATKPCRVYWHEINSVLKIRDCSETQIAALKPSATDNLSIVWFDLKSGAFYDYLSGVKDRGTCTKMTKGPGKPPLFQLKRHPCEGLYSK